MGGTKLDDVAGATIGAKKIGNGADAPKWFQAGQVQRVVNYCADDVAIERDLADFVDCYGYVVVKGKQLYIKR
jgi:DEAD/DEAH box helicase domain-containing protein